MNPCLSIRLAARFLPLLAVAAILPGLGSRAAAAELAATFSSATAVPITAAGYTATGNTVNLALSFSPAVGEELTVVNNTGTSPIQGAFGNLAQGQAVTLSYNGVAYPFVANYFGGSGNDLVLEWGNNRLWGWGSNGYGRVTGTPTTTSPITSPGSVDGGWGPLSGKTLLAMAAGDRHSVAVCTDGTLVSWGDNEYQKLGRNLASGTRDRVGLVDTSGVLAGKRVVAVAASSRNGMALCSDGTLAEWGWITTPTYSRLPALVSGKGALAGKTVVAISSTSGHSLVLCSDGTVAAWGANDFGQLGDGTTTTRNDPVAVNSNGVLSGKTVVAISAGWVHSLALCADGTLAAWGFNTSGSLGDGTGVSRTTPVAVNLSGVLSGKTVTAVAANGNHSLALCSDGTLAAWGENTSRQLGDGTTTNRSFPVLVAADGALAGRTVVRIAAGKSHSFAVCADGAMVGWGNNSAGGLGDDSTTSPTVPVLVSTAAFRTGERFCAAAGGTDFSLGLSALPPPPVVETLAASGVLDAAATMVGRVQAQGLDTAVSFEYGLTELYGATASGSPPTVGGSGFTAVSANLAGLLPGRTYHFRVVAINTGGTVKGADMTFTTSSHATLSGLTLSAGTLLPGFASDIKSYDAAVPFAMDAITLTPTAVSGDAVVTVNGLPVASGTASAAVTLAVGVNRIEVVVSAGGGNTATYGVTVNRLPERIAYASAGTAPVTVERFQAEGSLPELVLDFAPAPGTVLTVVRNTGMEFIGGRFANLAHGQEVKLAFNGVTYPFVANYYGGSGNDLVLQWANVRAFVWGGDGNDRIPIQANYSGVLAGKTILSVTGGSGNGPRAIAFCADGSLVGITSSKAVSLISLTGALSGKTVVAVAIGGGHYLALCSDGTLAAWGENGSGQLGDGSLTAAPVPVTVDQTGILADKRVVAISAGTSHSLALCADGTLVTWGSNSAGQLGSGGASYSAVPGLVDQSGVLAGRFVTAISATIDGCMVLCADGTLATWGGIPLGTAGSRDAKVPGLVDQTGVLAGKKVVAMAAGSPCVALCEDGTFVVWGGYYSGTGIANGGAVPALVSRSGALAGKTVTSFSMGEGGYCLVGCADGTAAAWGSNSTGVLGNNSTTIGETAPVAVVATNLPAGARFMTVSDGACSRLSVGLVALLPPPTVTTLEATAVNDTEATLNAEVQPNGLSAQVFFEYGLTTAYGAKVSGIPATVSGSEASAVSLMLRDLLAGTTYHYRVVVSNAAGVITGEDLTFTTTNLAALSGLALTDATLAPAFSGDITGYVCTVPFAITGTAVTAVAANEGATVRINGAAVPSGRAGEPLPLSVGPNPILIAVTAADGIHTKSYRVTVTRLPETFAFPSATAVPVTAAGFQAEGNTATFALTFVPAPGTVLTVVNNTGAQPILGTFANLAQGQRLNLTFNGVSYPFVANYYGGSGNDLVLQWANTRLVAWGGNGSGQLGNNGTTNSVVPVSVEMTGALANRTVIATAAGGEHSVALCADGTLAAWGRSTYGQLGDGTTSSTAKTAPVLVNQSGVLAGRTVIKVAAGLYHSLALCADGTLAAWGYNNYGQLGIGDSTNRNVPALVDRAGVLAGKTVVAVEAGAYFSLVLCSDGTMAAWGVGGYGQLGHNSTGSSSLPVAVDRSGVLAGKAVVAISTGFAHALALCADGTVAAWGDGRDGRLGNNTTTDTSTPVLVDHTGALAGKTVTRIGSGSSHNLAQCADGTLVSWGSNFSGQLGINTSTSSSAVPVAVYRSGVLSGKTIKAAPASSGLSHVQCDDGSIAYWGNLASTGEKYAPVLVATAGSLKSGETFQSLWSGSMAGHVLAAVASPPPQASTLAASGITDTRAVMNGTVSANNMGVSVSFEYGLTASYGSTVAATPAIVAGSVATAVSASLTGLLPGTSYHYRVVISGAAGTAYGADRSFSTTSLGTLSRLSLSEGALAPAFTTLTESYLATVPFATNTLRVNPVASDAAATVRVNGVIVASGSDSEPLDLAVGSNLITVGVTSRDGVNAKTYAVRVTRLPQALVFDAVTTVPLVMDGLAAAGNAPPISLNFAPAAGAELMIVRNTGAGLIHGTFDGLAQGQVVGLSHGGVIYPFSADYFGGTGNDLVLRWAATRLLAWGRNDDRQLGNGTATNSVAPAAMADPSGVFAGRTFIAAAAGERNSFAVFADGCVVSWGSDSDGKLGDGSLAGHSGPVTVNHLGRLAGRQATTVAAGWAHVLARCHDGTLATWGDNGYGQSGGSQQGGYNSLPADIGPLGVLAGRAVASVAAGYRHSLARCTDGTLAAWGQNADGELGDNSTTNSSTPVAVDSAGVLAGKSVTAISAGTAFNLVLCSDGTLASWGLGGSGQLGNGAWSTSKVPVLVIRLGALSGKTVTAIAAGDSHCLALCSDGTVVAWGANASGQLGDGTTTRRNRPVVVNRTGVLAGRTVAAIAAGAAHSLALCSDGALVSWGANTNGELGNETTTNSLLPELVNSAALQPGERVIAVSAGSRAQHSLAIVASPPPPVATTLPVAALTPTTATLNGSVNAAGGTVSVAFEYGLTNSYGSTVAAAPSPVGGTATTEVNGPIIGLSAGTTYHYRVVATGANGTAHGDDMTFTASSPPAFAGFEAATPWQTPILIPLRKLLARVTDPDGDAVSLTAVGMASAQGGALLMQPSGVLYTPPAGFVGTDTFTVGLTDIGGASVTGVVKVNVGPAPGTGGVGANPPNLTILPGGRVAISFQGIPGRTYVIQRSASGLGDWVALATLTADAAGRVSFTDESPPPGSAFYRIALP